MSQEHKALSTSSVPQIQFTPSGIVLPSDSDILTGAQADIDAAFGGGLNPSLYTPQGQLASSLSAIVADKNALFAYFLSQIDPLYSEGRFQDAIARIYFLERKGAQSTVVPCVLTGNPGTVIAQGTLAQDTNGNTYYSLSDVTISPSGNANAQFANILGGPIPCAAGTLTKVYQTVIGWDAITNPTDGIIGNLEEGRADFEYRRKNSVAANSHGSPQSMYASVFSVPGVTDVYVIDNFKNITVNTGSTSYPVAPHSVYVAVVGGADSDIAKAIWIKKDLGCNMNGNTTVIVTDDSGYNYPQPSYEITFNRPSPVAIKFAVNIVSSPTLPADIVARVKNAIINRFTGATGDARERVGGGILASNYYAPVVNSAPIVSLISVFIGTVSATLLKVDVGIDQVPTLNASDIVVNLV
jgi:uncharacterized phage protein gp47/JayE